MEIILLLAFSVYAPGVVFDPSLFSVVSLGI